MRLCVWEAGAITRSKRGKALTGSVMTKATRAGYRVSGQQTRMHACTPQSAGRAQSGRAAAVENVPDKDGERNDGGG